MPEVEIYTTAVCPYCIAAKRLLKEQGVEFTEHGLDFKPGERRELSEKLDGWRTVPMVFVDGRFIGGYTELREFAAHGGLENALSENRPSTPG